ncbi:MAG: DUF1190 domain-containing protein [Alphaproteobacteria bacterium]|nr:DUF1190 domain-containing protein [Alphaproteobacteria bacterium]
MRRSSRISTLLVGSTCLLMLASCGDDDQDKIKIYGDAEACTAENDAATCEREAKEAATRHVETAPRYPQQQSCEQLHGVGNCQPTPVRDASGQTANWFMPALAGFMLSRALSNPYPQPIYRDSQGFAFGGGTVYGGYDAGQNRTASVSRSSASPVSTAGGPGSVRGGFGSTASRSGSSSGS